VVPTGDEDIPGDATSSSLDFFYDDSAGSELRPLSESPSNYLVGSQRCGVVDFRGTAVAQWLVARGGPI
jgi:hypothetical protein